MTRGIKYEDEFKERTVRLYLERRAEHQEESKAASVRSVAELVGMPANSLLTWARAAEGDAVVRPVFTRDKASELRRLRRENAELSRANAILKTAAAYYAARLDRPRRQS